AHTVSCALYAVRALVDLHPFPTRPSSDLSSASRRSGSARSATARRGRSRTTRRRKAASATAASTSASSRSCSLSSVGAAVQPRIPRRADLGVTPVAAGQPLLPKREGGGGGYHLPVFGIDCQGSCGGSASPFCSSSIEMLSGERTNAMRPSRGGRLIVTPASISRRHVA